MAISVADIEFRLSGGAANTDPLASLGGIVSSQKVLSQVGTGVTNITGVVIDDAAGNAEGAGTLSYVTATGELTWQAFGEGVAGAAVAVGGADGKYAIPSSAGGYLFVTVTAASLPGTDQSDTVTIANLANKVFDDISPAESFAGDTEYRCLYIMNTNGTDTAFGVTVWVQSQPVGDDSIALGVDPAGVGNGSSTGVATTVADESSAPAGVTFSAPATQGAGLVLGDLAPGQCAAFWQRRTVPSTTTNKTLNDWCNIGVAAYL